MNYIFYLFVVLTLFSGCSQKSAVVEQEAKIYDLTHYEQNISIYSKNIEDKNSLYDIQNEYEDRYFLPWRYEKVPFALHSVTWPFRSYTSGDKYGEDLKKIDKAFFDEMSELSNFGDYGNTNRKGISVKYAHVRNFPTDKPLFKDPSIAGEGFPFDYTQNSSIHANEPLFISHFSKDGLWAYIFTSYVSGWIKIDSFAFITDDDATTYMESIRGAVVKENALLKDQEGNSILYLRIGMTLPIVETEEDFYTVLIAQRDLNQNNSFKRAKIKSEYVTDKPLLLNRENLTNIFNQFVSTKYGWGGIFELRDCSSTLRDAFAPFGIWLPRNSYQQSRVGSVVSLEYMTDKQKIEAIKKDAIPFETLIYKKGHIVLYLGTFEDEIMVFHNTWGLKTIKDENVGREIIAKSVISTLELGKDLPDFDQKSTLLHTISSFNIITK